jgi:hypothetical protein
MRRLPAELESRILAMPGTRAGRTVAELMQPVEPPPAFESEKDFMAAVIREAKKLGWRIYHTHDSRKSAAGFPDLVLVRERVVWVELKTEGGQLTAAQANWFDDLTAAGQEVYVWRPNQWPEVLRVLAGLRLPSPGNPPYQNPVEPEIGPPQRS